MPSKSRRSRRNIPHNNPGMNNTENARQDSTQAFTPPVIQTERMVRPARTSTAVPVPTPNILNEIKWIAVVAVIIIAMLIVLYYTVG